MKMLFLEVDGSFSKSQDKHIKHFLELDDLQTKSQVKNNRYILENDDLHIKSKGETLNIFLNLMTYTPNHKRN